MNIIACNVCGKEFPITSEYFYLRKDGYFNHVCKSCMKAKDAVRREKRKEYMKKYLQDYYEHNKESINERNKEYYYNHHELVREQQARYQDEHREEIKNYHASYVSNKRKFDPVYKLKQQMRSNIRFAFARKGFSKQAKLNEITGISCEELCDYLLKTFRDRYKREWDGIEQVHIDHVVPLSAAKTENEVVKLCHFTNLQLLTAKDNIMKSDKIK